MQLFTIFLLIPMMLCAAGCGPSKTGGRSSASRSTSQTPTNSNYKLAECVRFSASTLAIDGYMSTYYNPTTGTIRLDFLNLLLSSIPNEVARENTYSVQFFRWTENVAGQRVTNTLPTRFMVIDRLNSNMVMPNTVDRIDKALVDNSIKTFGSGTTVTANNFVQRVQFVLTGVDYNYNGITIALVNSSNINVAQASYLLPPFYADPNIYARLINVFTLQAMHPYYSLRLSGGQESDFYQMAESVCTDMVTTNNRVPASVTDSSIKSLWNSFMDWIKSLF